MATKTRIDMIRPFNIRSGILNTEKVSNALSQSQERENPNHQEREKDRQTDRQTEREREKKNVYIKVETKHIRS